MKKISTLLFAILFAFTVSAQGLDFDGWDDYLEIPGHTDVISNTAFTFKTWIKPRLNGSDYQAIATKGQGDPFFLYIEGMGHPMMEEPTTEFILMCDLWSTDWTLFRAHYVLPADFFDNWHHIAASFTGTTWTLFVDGVAVSSMGTWGTFANHTSEPLYPGMYQGMWNFSGVMDEVRIWNTGRDQSQIVAGMNMQLPGNTPGLVSYYTFNQGTAGGNNLMINTATDASPMANNATLFNFSKTGGSSNFVSGNPMLTILPVYLHSFTAREEGSRILLNWHSTQEGLTEFIVERSSDGVNFSGIGTVAVNSMGRYTLSDAKPLPGKNVYRLSGTIASGRKEYSRSLVVKRENSLQLKLYPNPAVGQLFLQLHYKGAETVTIRDISGNPVKKLALPFSTETSHLTVQVDVSALPAGTYFVAAGGQNLRFIKL